MNVQRGARARRLATGILGQLNSEWSALTVRDHRDVVAEWVARHPALRPAHTLDEVAQLVLRRSGDNDEELAALIALTQSGDPLAAQALMHVLIGPACRLAARTRHHADDLESSRCQAVGAMWLAVRSYRLGTRRHHVTGLTLDALRLVTRRSRGPVEHPVAAPGELERPGYGTDIGATTESLRDGFWSRTEPDAALPQHGELAQLLAWAVARAVISQMNADILWRMHGPGRTTSATIGRTFGLSDSAIRERARHALRAVSAAVRRASVSDVGQVVSRTSA